MWKATGILEGLGFHVRTFVCDGASTNRRFYKIHGNHVATRQLCIGHGTEHLTYKAHSNHGGLHEPKFVTAGIMKYSLHGLLGDDQRTALFKLCDVIGAITHPVLQKEKIPVIQAAIDEYLVLVERDYPCNVMTANRPHPYDEPEGCSSIPDSAYTRKRKVPIPDPPPPPKRAKGKDCIDTGSDQQHTPTTTDNRAVDPVPATRHQQQSSACNSERESELFVQSGEVDQTTRSEVAGSEVAGSEVAAGGKAKSDGSSSSEEGDEGGDIAPKVTPSHTKETGDKGADTTSAELCSNCVTSLERSPTLLSRKRRFRLAITGNYRRVSRSGDTAKPMGTHVTGAISHDSNLTITILVRVLQDEAKESFPGSEDVPVKSDHKGLLFAYQTIRSLIGAIEALAKKKPGARVWFKADACDLKVALQTSMKGKWNGDADLGDGGLQRMFAESTRRMELVKEAGKLSGRDRLEACLRTLLVDIEEDVSMLDRGQKAAHEKYEAKFRQRNSSVELLKSLAWDRIEYHTLLEQAKAFRDRYEGLLANLNPSAPATRDVMKCLAELKSDSETYLTNVFKKKRQPADHALVIMMADERRQHKPYAVPVQLVPYHSIRDQQLQDLLDECHVEARKAGLVPVEDDNGKPLTELKEMSIPEQVIQELHQLTAVEGMTEEDAIMRLRGQLVPPGYSPASFRVNSPESHLDRLKSILATYRYRHTLNEYYAQGVNLKENMYVPEQEEGVYVHRREDHCHVLKRIASHLRSDPPPPPSGLTTMPWRMHYIQAWVSQKLDLQRGCSVWIAKAVSERCRGTTVTACCNFPPSQRLHTGSQLH
uniref:Uncharacterized protein n=1 Tax=Branchiostoma floridae TaxID=7739 RepID=C3ZYJ9_BRAFL|eukprot:XP_002586372.1 hypothetical protein BRAFLDRAFT_108657 [Branchiostoma floridae]